MYEKFPMYALNVFLQVILVTEFRGNEHIAWSPVPLNFMILLVIFVLKATHKFALLVGCHPMRVHLGKSHDFVSQCHLSQDINAFGSYRTTVQVLTEYRHARQ